MNILIKINEHFYEIKPFSNHIAQDRWFTTIERRVVMRYDNTFSRRRRGYEIVHSTSPKLRLPFSPPKLVTETVTNLKNYTKLKRIVIENSCN